MKRLLGSLVIAGWLLLMAGPALAGSRTDVCANIPGIQNHVPNGYEQVILGGVSYCAPPPFPEPY